MQIAIAAAGGNGFRGKYHENQNDRIPARKYSSTPLALTHRVSSPWGLTVECE
jgi:hypothetical protein